MKDPASADTAEQSDNAPAATHFARARFIFPVPPLTNYPHGSPCPSLPSKGCNTDFYNNDITATKTFGNWDLGPVGFYSTDLNKPIPSYQKQSQFAVGFLVGYHVGPAVLQTYLTRVVYQKNYDGYDTRLWASIQLKLW